MNCLDLSRQAILLTGSAGLLGGACAEALAAAGANLALLDVNEQRLNEQLQTLREKYGGQHFVGYHDVDSLNTESLDALLSEVQETFGSLSTVICAAYPRSADWHLDFLEVPLASWRENVDQHLNGYIHTAQRAARLMKRQGSGNIIFFGSIYGLVGPDFSLYEGLPHMTMPAAYAAIKGALVQMTRYLACYLGPQGIRVNCLCPGGIKDAQPEPFIQRYEAKVPLRRLGTPDDIVGPLLFLCSDLSRYVTGQCLVADGGWTSL